MDRRHYLSVLLLLSAAVVALGPTVSPAPAPCDGCNVVIVSIDTLRADHVGAYGYGRNTTPHIDQLAQRSSVFHRTFASSTYSIPSHMSLFTGMFAASHGVRAQNARTRGFTPGLTMLPEVFQGDGYRTISAHGKNIRDSFGFRRGFDIHHEFNRTGLYPWQEAAFREEHALYQREIVSALSGDDPVFAFYHVFAPHDPYFWPPRATAFEAAIPAFAVDARQRWRTLWSRYSAWENSSRTDRYKHLMTAYRTYYAARMQENASFREHAVAQYDGSVRVADTLVGSLLERLRRNGHLEDTILVITADHGEQFGEHGGFWHQSPFVETVRVPLIISVPGMSQVADVRTDTRTIDIAPTLLDLTGITVPAFERQKQGRSLFRALQGKTPQPRTLMATDPFAMFSPAESPMMYVKGVNGTFLYNMSADVEQQHPLQNRTLQARIRQQFTDFYASLPSTDPAERGKTWPYFG